MAIASQIPTRPKIKIALRRNSLAARLITAAAGLIVLGLVAGGFLLSGVFRDTAEDSFDAKLVFYLDGLIAAASPATASTGLALDAQFADPRFQRIYSGWYWQIVPDNAGKPGVADTQVSRSLWDKTVVITSSRELHGLIWGYGAGPEDQRLRVLQRHIDFPILKNGKTQSMHGYMFLAAGDLSEVDNDVNDFNGTLIWSFTILGAGLILAIFIQVRIGLRPLRRVSDALARIGDGNARRLEGKFPAEIEPLANELNSLIDHSAEVVSRARTHVSNLAHFLKTPLTVLSSEAAAQTGPLADSVLRQVDVMRRQVDHYLVRARAAGALDVIGSRTPVKPVLDNLARTLKRIHAERPLSIAVDCPSTLVFRGDKQDLEEMAGNLIDNACKWAKSRVQVIVARGLGNTLEVVVGDDGPGLSPEDRARVGERGERLDENVPGTGLGLAITRDIAKLYGGSLSLGAAGLGGLETRLILPGSA